jgi:hypothetical protein
MEDKIKQEIILDEKCGVEINKTFSILRICVSIYLVWILFSLYKHLFDFFYSEGDSYLQSDFILENKVVPIIYILQSIVILIGVYYQFAGFKIQRKAILIFDSRLFMLSYKYLRNGIWTSLIVTFFNILVYLIFRYLGNTNY